MGDCKQAYLHFSIQVINVNDAPSISGQPATSVVEGESYRFTPSATDIDSNTLTFNIQNKPSWAQFNPQTGELSGTPSGNDIGTTQGIIIGVSDGQLSTSLAPFNLTVGVRNTAPKVSGQRVEVNEDSRVTIKAQAVDDQGDTLSLSVQSQPQNGALSIIDGGWLYSPNANYHGQDSFSYVASDGKLTSDSATVTVTVKAVNDTPSAMNDNITLTQTANDIYQLAVLGNDADIDGDVLRIEGATASLGRVVSVNDTITYQAPADYIGPVTLSYSVTDSNTGRAKAEVNLLIEGNRNTQAPTLLVPNDLTVDATGLFTKVDLGVASAKDSQGNVLPVSLVESNTVFSPGKHTVYWQTQDSGGLKTIAQQGLNVKPLISLSKDQIVAEGSKVMIQVLLNGPSPTYPLEVGYSVSGSATSQDHTAQNGTIVFEKGTEAHIHFDILGDNIAENEETVIVTLEPTANLGSKHQTVVRIRESNIAPTLAMRVEQQEDIRLTVSQKAGPVTIYALTSDVNAADTLSVSWQSDLSNISAVQSRFVFDPSAVALGMHAVKATVSDNGTPALSASKVVYIEVVEQLATLDNVDTDGDLIPDDQEGYSDSDGDGIPDFQDAINECNVVPAKVSNQTAFLAEGEPGVCLRRGAVAALSVTGGLQLESDQQQGIVADSDAKNIGGLFDYIAYGLPNQGQNYTLVLPQQQPVPAKAVYRKYTQAKGWSEFVEDENNQVFSSAGELGYCPPPGDALWQPGLTEGHWCVQLIVQDGGPNDADGEANGTVVDPSGVAVYLTNNTQPVAQSDTVELPWNTSIDIDVLSNDSDADNDSLSLSQASAQFGKVVITEQNKLNYTAAENFVGTDVVTYSITDGQGGTGHSQVTVEVIGNRAPKVQGEQITALHHKSVIVDVLANDSDPDGDTLTISAASAANGEVTIVDGTKLSYISNVGFAGVDTVSYVVSDNQGGQAEGVMQVQVTANRLPITQSDSAQVTSGSSVTLDVLANDSDADGDQLSIISASALQGSVSIEGGTQLVYTAKSDFTGTDAITYQVSDGYGDAVTGTVSIDVKAAGTDGNTDTDGDKTGSTTQHRSSGGALLWIYLAMAMIAFRRRSPR